MKGTILFKQRIKPHATTLFETTLPEKAYLTDMSIENDEIILEGRFLPKNPPNFVRKVGFIEYPPEDPDGSNFDKGIREDDMVTKHYPFRGHPCRLAINKQGFC